MTKKDSLSMINKLKKFYKEKNKKPKSFQEFASEAIMGDLMDRRGIKNIFYEIKEEDIKLFNDIKKTWQYIIEYSLDYFEEKEFLEKL